jgi:hypothetical protein
MTPDEHMLVLQLLFKQRQALRILLDMLKSRGVLTDDDEQAFSSAQTQNAPSNAAIFEEAKSLYLMLADSLELETGLLREWNPPISFFEPPKS